MNQFLELINQVESCNFQCEAGPLKDLSQWKQLKALIEPVKEVVFPTLERPLCFIDLETTGVDLDECRIVEISVLKYETDASWKITTRRINPGIPIPKEASDIHGITDADVKDCPSFAQVSKALWNLILGCDIAGFNSNRFDVPVLFNHLERAGIPWNWQSINLIDIRNIYVQKEERNLAAAVKFYLGRDHEGAHSAEADITATMEIFLQQISRYEDLPKSFKDLALFSNYGKEFIDLAGKFTRNEKGVIVFNFGKHIGKEARSEREYLSWMMDKGKFNTDTKYIARKLWMNQFP